MQLKTVTQVFIWSRWLRLTHWTLAITTLGLIATGWLMTLDSSITVNAIEFHYIFLSLFIPALLVRLYLLVFGKGTDHLSDCEPNTHRLSQAWEVIRFYITLGKAPLPRWYSHNPLWGMLYLALFFFLVLSTASGAMLMKDQLMIGSISMLSLHQLCYQITLAFSLLHIIAVFAHDLSSKAGDNSAMINGYRTFEVGENSPDKSGQSQHVSVDNLMKQLRK